jgi:hypothetical protein
MVSVRDSQVVVLLRFETAVQKVLAVTLLPGCWNADLINDDGKLLAQPKRGRI